jgi:hypothetical protein
MGIAEPFKEEERRGRIARSGAIEVLKSLVFLFFQWKNCSLLPPLISSIWSHYDK